MDEGTPTKVMRGGSMHARRILALTAAAVIAISACTPAASTAPSATPGAPTPGASPTEAAISGPNAELTAALAGDYDGETVDVFAQWIDAEGQAFDDSLDAFRDATGINVVYSGITNYETVLGARVDGGLAPDIAQIAQAGSMRKYAADGKLIDLDTVLDGDQVREDYSPGFIDAGSSDGTLYGLFYKQDLKSIVWYPVQAFADAGYEVPTTWDELVALSDKIVEDGSNPWCTSIEHGDASGWVVTDWIEDVLLRTEAPEVYDQWVAHEIPFNDPKIVAAAEIVGDMFFTEGYTYGGSARINGTWVGDSQSPMFDAPPKCWLHKQAAWIPDFWPEGKVPEVDSKFFYFPAIEEEFGNPVLGGSDMFMMFNDRPEVRALMQWFSTPDSVAERVATGSFLAASNAIPLDSYTSYPMSGLAEIAQNATVSRADASDSMPTAVQSAFWAGMIKWVSQNGEGTQAIFDEIEASWP
jgi:alpha-glucoside transport system substrate-binding protein